MEPFNNTLTLAQWCENTGYAASYHHQSGAYVLPDTVPQGYRWALHHLTDYVVSSIIAGSIWLVKRNLKVEEHS